MSVTDNPNLEAVAADARVRLSATIDSLQPAHPTS